MITALSVDPECTAPDAVAPENGHFLRIDIEGEVAPGFSDQLYFDGGVWKVIADNGTTVNGSPATYAAYTCLTDSERLPSRIGAGEKVNGSIVLDVPTASGILLLEMFGAEGGWEWNYGG